MSRGKRISLTNSSEIAIVDKEDFSKASRRKWFLDRNGHVRSTNHPQIFLHHLVGGEPPKGLETDHRNGNPLDNRRSNLRNATPRQNQMNSGKQKNNASGFKGVFWSPRRKKWKAVITLRGKKKFLGRFDSPIEAAKTYDKAATRLFGEFARPNFPMRFPRELTIIQIFVALQSLHIRLFHIYGKLHDLDKKVRILEKRRK